MNNKVHPPRWAKRLLRWLHPKGTLEEVEGDLDELYVYWYRRGRSAASPTGWAGKTQATLRYLLNVVSVLPPFVRRRKREKDHYQPYLLHPDMIRNYLKIAWRNLTKNKAYSFINIGGLAVGMAVAMLNGLWIWDELSFNTYHTDYSRIAKVMKRGTDQGNPFVGASLQYPLALELKANYGDYFEHLLMAQEVNEFALSVGETKLFKQGQFIEAGAPEMLGLHMIEGTRAGLKDPYSILLSASAAKALFGAENPMGRQVTFNTDLNVSVTGVYEDLPHNTEFHKAQFFVPWELYVSSVNPGTKEKGWDNTCLSLYAEINPATDIETVSARIKDVELNKIRHLEGLTHLVAQKPQLFLHPMSQWHLYSNFKAGTATKDSVNSLWLIGLIGVFVLLLACINFMNLSTARSEKRAREVGIRKAVGSRRGQLIGQFFGESLLVVTLAFLLALLLTLIALPLFNGIAAKELNLLWTNRYFWFITIAFILLTSFVAGSYPALFLSSFQPVNVLKGISFGVGRTSVIPRKILVITQFTVSVVLICSTLIVYRQVDHAKSRPVGYNRDGLIVIRMKSAELHNKYGLFRSELKNTGFVYEVAKSQSPTTGVHSDNNGFTWRGDASNVDQRFGTLSVTSEYGKTVGWQFIAGRDFSKDLASDSSGFVINESAANVLGMKNPIGEIIRWNSKLYKGNFKIIGVIKDMVMESPFKSTRPTIFFMDPYHNWITIRIKPTVNAAEALPIIETVFKKLIPSSPFDYKFADQEYALKFAAEERIGNLAAIFAILAIFISCLGLFGLASFMAEARTKEIGIRKVLGASMFNLWALLSKDFVMLVIIAFFIAVPIAYYFLTGWLQSYEYRTRISWWIFAASGLGALVITLLTVSYQSIRAALMNPVKSLRSE